MKKKQIFLCLLSICLLLGGCSVVENESFDTTAQDESTISTSIETAPEPIYPLLVDPTQKPFMPSGQTSQGGEAIEYFFGSAADLELYLKTGSKNRDDYDTPPSILPSSVERYHKYGYLAILRLLNVDETDFDKVYVSFIDLDDGNVQFRYYLDKHFITVELAAKQTLPEQHLYKMSATLSKNDILSADKQNSVIGDGHTLCNADGIEYIVWKENGIKRGIFLLLGDFYVRIIPTWGLTDEEKRADCFDSFMTDEKTATLAPFFKDDIAEVAAQIAATQKVVSEAATK